MIAGEPEPFGPHSPGIRSVPCGKHLIFFAPIRATKAAPVILRIAHQRRYLG